MKTIGSPHSALYCLFLFRIPANEQNWWFSINVTRQFVAQCFLHCLSTFVIVQSPPHLDRNVREKASEL